MLVDRISAVVHNTLYGGPASRMEGMLSAQFVTVFEEYTVRAESVAREPREERRDDAAE